MSSDQREPKRAAAPAHQGRAALLAAIHRASRQLTNQNGLYTDAAAQTLGMNRTDLDCLSIVHLSGSVTAGELAAMTGLTTGAVTGVIDRLENAGYVAREADPHDRRRVIVRAVPERGRAVGELFDPMQQAIGELYASYTDDELALLLDVNDRLLPIMQEETAKLRRSATGEAPTTETSAPLGDLAGARLEFVRGAANAVVRSRAGLGELYRARLDGHGPTITAQDGTVSVSYKRTGFRWGRAGQCEMDLNPAIPWSVAVRGGASKFRADLGDIVLRQLELVGGISDAEIRLPAPAGTVAVRVDGGARNLSLHRPAGAALRVHIRGGVSNLRLDDQRFGAVGGSMSWKTPGYDAAPDRYELTLTGGASTLTVN